MPKTLPVLLAAFALSGCASKHFTVCMETATGAGCSHHRFTAADAERVRALLAGQPISEQIKVWVEDIRKTPELPPQDSGSPRPIVPESPFGSGGPKL